MKRHSRNVVDRLGSWAIVLLLAGVPAVGRDAAASDGPKAGERPTAAAAAAKSVELPAEFPDDVPLAAYMTPKSVDRVQESFRVGLHAKNRTLTEATTWFQTEMVRQGWTADGESINEKRAILAFTKDERRCAITVTDFVFDDHGRRDKSIGGIKIQAPALTE